MLRLRFDFWPTLVASVGKRFALFNTGRGTGPYRVPVKKWWSGKGSVRLRPFGPLPVWGRRHSDDNSGNFLSSVVNIRVTTNGDLSYTESDLRESSSTTLFLIPRPPKEPCTRVYRVHPLPLHLLLSFLWFLVQWRPLVIPWPPKWRDPLIPWTTSSVNPRNVDSLLFRFTTRGSFLRSSLSTRTDLIPHVFPLPALPNYSVTVTDSFFLLLNQKRL